MTDDMAHRLREARVTQRLTIRGLAELAHVAPNTITRAERGEPVTYASLVRLTDALGVPRSDDAGQTASADGADAPTVTAASRIVLDIPGDEVEGLTPTELQILRREAEAAWLRARRGM